MHHDRKNGARRRAAIAVTAMALAVPITVAATTSTASTKTSTTTSVGAVHANRTASCATTWGSLPEATSPALLWTGSVTAARSGRHDCFDRVVFDISRGAGTLGYAVRYVAAVTSPASGLPVAVSGGARLQVTINAPATTVVPPGGATTYTGWSTFRQLKWVTSFEGYTDLGLGVRARLPMRAFTIDNPDGSRRLVVDVAHTW